MCRRRPLLILLVLAAASCLLPSASFGQTENPPFLQTPFHQPTPATGGNAVRQATHAEVVTDRLSPPQHSESQKLPPPPSEGKQRLSKSSPMSAIFTVLGSLALVLGLFFGLAWLMRRGLPQGRGQLPTGVVEVLGHTMLVARRQLHVLRFGEKLLLVCVSQNGVETLGEIDDAAEVERLSKLCESSRNASPAAAFDQVLNLKSRGKSDSPPTIDSGLAALAFRKKSASAGEVST